MKQFWEGSIIHLEFKQTLLKSMSRNKYYHVLCYIYQQFYPWKTKDVVYCWNEDVKVRNGQDLEMQKAVVQCRREVK